MKKTRRRRTATLLNGKGMGMTLGSIWCIGFQMTLGGVLEQSANRLSCGTGRRSGVGRFHEANWSPVSFCFG
jgi:hypothetical protein